MIREENENASDEVLIGRYVEGRDERAFQTLVGRHSPMVMSTVRRVLRDVHDAEDAFQATFLTLATSADRLRRRAAVAAWLHGTAYRCAALILRENMRQSKRRQHVGEPDELSTEIADTAVESSDPSIRIANEEMKAILDEEITRLPLKLRRAIVMCDLKGMTRKEAAKQLGLPLPTLTHHVSKARETLCRRLQHRGVTLSLAGLAAYCEGAVASMVSPKLIRETTSYSFQYAAGNATQNVSLTAINIAKKMNSTMNKARLSALGFIAFGILAFMGAIANSFGLVGSDSVVHAQSITDDFEDGNVTDGRPLTWTTNPTSEGQFSVVNGSYVASGFDDELANEVISSDVRDQVFNDVSVQTQATIDIRGRIGLTARLGGDELLNGYLGFLNTNGFVGIGRLEGSAALEEMEFITPVFQPEGLPNASDEINIRFDAIGTEFSLWIWPKDEDMPQAPTITATDGTYASGHVGVWYQEGNLGPDKSGLFREFKVTPVPEPTSAALSVLAVLSMAVARSRIARLG